MPIFTHKIKYKLEEKKLSIYRLSKIIDYHEGALNAMINSKKSIPLQVKEKLLPILEVSREEFEGWILTDKYPKEVLELAIQAKQEKSRVCHSGLDPESHEILNQVQDDKREKLIFTIKIDEILKQKGLSRTKLAKQINHSQSGLNRVIIGKEPLSKGVIQKLSPALEVTENTINSWVVADKYTIEVLQNAIEELH